MADVSYVVGDTAPSLFGTLTNADGTAFDLTGATVRFQMRWSIDRRFKVNSPATIINDAGGTVRYDWAVGDLDTEGDYVSHWLVTFGDSTQEHTFPANTLTVAPA